MPHAERRLSVILAADVVGYSRLVEADESGTLTAIKGLRDTLLEPLLAAHRGRIVKLLGDGLLAEFGSVVGAVACAADLGSSQRGRKVYLLSVESFSVLASTSAMWWSRATICWVMVSTWRPAWSSSASRVDC